jgi:UDPglucose 6-dehydrogenase
MEKPSYVFDGRNILRKLQLEKIGFDFYAIGQKVV